MNITRDKIFEKSFLYKEISQQISYIVIKPVNIYVGVQNGLAAQPPVYQYHNHCTIGSHEIYSRSTISAVGGARAWGRSWQKRPVRPF